MSNRDIVDRAENSGSDEPSAKLGEADVLPLELTVREGGGMTEFSAPMGAGVNDSLQWVTIESWAVVKLEDWQ